MKKRIIGATLITVVCALLISNLVGVLLFRSREMDAARNTLQELLVLMDAQSAITDPDGLAQQFHAAAPDKRLTIIDTDGTVKNFAMNDKCAAGTGRFLDVMARVLEVKVEELGDLGDKSTKEVGISSTCTVFAESEVISQLAMGTNKCDIIHGIHKSVAGRVSGLCHRIGVRDDVVMTGGVAQNHGIVKALQEQLGHEIHTTPLTQYNGALGAALFAYQKALKNK